MELYLNSFLNLTLDGCECSTSRPRSFTVGKSAPGNDWIWGWVDPRARLDALAKRKFPFTASAGNLYRPWIICLVVWDTVHGPKYKHSYDSRVNGLKLLLILPLSYQNSILDIILSQFYPPLILITCLPKSIDYWLLFSYRLLAVPGGCFPRGFLAKLLHVFLVCPILAILAAHRGP
jgi:hypothetical protein